MKKKLQLFLLSIAAMLLLTITNNAQTPESYFIDFGTSDSPAQTGYVQIPVDRVYGSGNANGWRQNDVDNKLSFTKDVPSAANNLLSDHAGSGGYCLFRQNTEAEEYQVTLHFYNETDVEIGANVFDGTEVVNNFFMTPIVVPADTYVTKVFTIDLSGAINRAEFGFYKDASSTKWICNGIDLIPTSTLSLEQEIEKGFKMYNNPQTKELKISLPTSGKGELTIFDLTGKQVLSKTLLSADNAVNVSTLPVSVYVARIVTDNGTISRKVALR
ncbi:T9SS type A sorting domain-containing protein [Flavivirga abyssicola]|uniref:T9SS type A sorting domain-containing protein n=1 Tax=Flavivirga abyssicola TaxID=3063533 RepID=UPI0026DFC77D|nr:T9SS type A sorting domain-containing protein [Flavivirga sp. MEBiC07777]WVK11998.1 T9SS type A sorting domain-containing protein [Flavivirga sp. MEBiC07777]